MAKIYPSQIRTINPFEEYYSNITNRLTRIVSNTKNCIHLSDHLDVTIDATAAMTYVLMSSGNCFIDDVFIQITQEKRIDLEDGDYYFSTPFNEVGYYYLTLEYEYRKAKPSPQARIRIIKPSETLAYYSEESKYLFLKAIKVSFNGATFEIDSVHDYDLLNNENRRNYSLFDKGSIDERIDTSQAEINRLGYLDGFGQVKLAIATAISTLATCVVTNVDANNGTVKLVGLVENIHVEYGVVIQTGEHCYLSDSDAGSVTNNQLETLSQFVGVCVSDSTSTIDMWFMPAAPTPTKIIQSDEMHIVSSAEETSKEITIPFTNLVGEKQMRVYVNGNLKSVVTTISGTDYGDYVETNSTTITFEDGVIVENDIIRFVI